MTSLIPRMLRAPERSFFLFGPRGTGKSTWLKRALPGAFRADLLDASLSLELGRNPHALDTAKRFAMEFIKVDDRMDRIEAAGERNADRILTALDQYTKTAEANNRAMVLHGQTLSDHGQTLKDHGKRLTALEAEA